MQKLMKPANRVLPVTMAIQLRLGRIVKRQERLTDNATHMRWAWLLSNLQKPPLPNFTFAGHLL